MSNPSSASLAKDLIKKVATDSKFRHGLTNAKSNDEKRAYLDSNGFKAIGQEDVVNAATGSVQELMDAELQTVASGCANTTTTATTTTTVWAGAAAAVAAG